MLEIAKGCGHNYYGEPAWPNDIFYVFPVVIVGFVCTSVGLATVEPCPGLYQSSPFDTPNEILPEWYFLPTFNVLRILEDKSVGVISLFTFALSPLIAPFVENAIVSQNPFHRFLATGTFLSFFSHVLIVTIGSAASMNVAFPF
jgi:cytochrome b6-f complex subunit 4